MTTRFFFPTRQTKQQVMEAKTEAKNWQAVYGGRLVKVLATGTVPYKGIRVLVHFEVRPQ